MAKMILISDEDLKGLIQEAVTNAVDGITRKITARSARLNYRNRLFQHSDDDDEDYSGFCGSSSTGGCGSAIPMNGGCGSSSYGGGCGSTGGC